MLKRELYCHNRIYILEGRENNVKSVIIRVSVKKREKKMRNKQSFMIKRKTLNQAVKPLEHLHREEECKRNDKNGLNLDDDEVDHYNANKNNKHI